MTAERCVAIDADHPALQYSGRIDFADPRAPVFLYAGNLVRARFTGPALAVRLAMSIDTGHPMWIGAIIDGGEMIALRLDPGAEERSYLVASGLADDAHELILLRKSDFVSGNCRFCGLTLAPGQTLLPPPSRPTRRLECYGDSITAGVLSDADGYEGLADPDDPDGIYNNPWHSYSFRLAQLVGAELYNNGIGGLPLLDGYGYVGLAERVGLETTYDKLQPIPGRGGLTPWDFARYTPQVVILAIGQNDSLTYPDPASDYAAYERWIAAYIQLLRKLRGHYPDAYLLLTTTLMHHAPVWDDLLLEISERLQDSRIVAYRFRRAGCGSPGHLRRREAEEMAAELAELIDSLDDPWQESVPIAASSHLQERSGDTE